MIHDNMMYCLLHIQCRSFYPYDHIIYQAVLESVFRYGVTAWFVNRSVQLKNKLCGLIHTAWEIISVKDDLSLQTGYFASCQMCMCVLGVILLVFNLFYIAFILCTCVFLYVLYDLYDCIIYCFYYFLNGCSIGDLRKTNFLFCGTIKFILLH